MPTLALAPCAQAYARVRGLRPATALALHLAALLCLLMMLTGVAQAQPGLPSPPGGAVSETTPPPADGIVLALSGQVSLLRAGQTQALTLAASVRQGDLIRTGADGRVQLRFSDAGLVSLQPGTEFRIEEYAFGQQGQRGFFELLRGALRAASGAIGKRNHEDYRIKTPTATIGIRGTVFTLVETVCEPTCPPGTRAGLLAHVTEGRIVVRNSAGALELPTGQAARASSATSAPVITPERPALTPQSLAPTKPAESTAARSSGGSSSADKTAQDKATQDKVTQDRTGTDKAGTDKLSPVATGESTLAAARAVPAATPRLDAMTTAASVGAAPVSAVALARPAVTTVASAPAAGSSAGLNLNNKALSILATGASSTASSSNASSSTAGGSLATINAVSSAVSSTGASSGGAISSITSGDAPATAMMASAMPAAVSVNLSTLSLASSPLVSAPAGNAIADQAASLSVQTSLPASNTGNALQAAASAAAAPVVVTVLASPAPAVTVAAAAVPIAQTPVVTVPPAATPIVAAAAPPVAAAAPPAAVATPPAAAPAPAALPPVTTPTVTAPAITAPSVSTPSVPTTTVAPAPVTTPVLTPAPSTLVSSSSATVTVPPAVTVIPAAINEPVAIAAPNGLWRLEIRNMPAQMSYSNAINAGEVVLDAQNRLRDIGPCPAIACLSAGTTRVAEAGNDAMVSWGRWTEGSTQLSFLGVNVATPYSANQGMHYLVGTPVVSLPTSGTFRYELLGATRPTTQDGSLAPGNFSGQAVVQFASGQSARVGLSAQVGIGAAQYGFQTNGGLANVSNSQLRVATDYGISGEIAFSGNACNGGRCLATVSGGLFGPGGERLGVSYSINPGANSTRIDGVAVFKR